MTSLGTSARLQNVIKYCIKVSETGPAGTKSRIIVQQFDAGSPRMTHGIGMSAFCLVPPFGGLLVRTYCQTCCHFNSMNFPPLSQGVGAPVGSVLVGSDELIAR